MQRFFNVFLYITSTVSSIDSLYKEYMVYWNCIYKLKAKFPEEYCTGFATVA